MTIGSDPAQFEGDLLEIYSSELSCKNWEVEGLFCLANYILHLSFGVYKHGMYKFMDTQMKKFS